MYPGTWDFTLWPLSQASTRKCSWHLFAARWCWCNWLWRFEEGSGISNSCFGTCRWSSSLRSICGSWCRSYSLEDMELTRRSLLDRRGLCCGLRCSCRQMSCYRALVYNIGCLTSPIWWFWLFLRCLLHQLSKLLVYLCDPHWLSSFQHCLPWPPEYHYRNYNKTQWK